MMKLNLFICSELLQQISEEYHIVMDDTFENLDPTGQALFVLRMYTFHDDQILTNIDYENIRFALRQISIEEDRQLKVKKANEITDEIRKLPYKLKIILINKINEYCIGS